MPKFKLTYFPAEGRAEACRLIMQIGGIEFEDERIAGSQFMERKPALPYGSLPVLEVDGAVFAQSYTLARYLGKLTNLYPSDPLEALKVDEISDGIADIDYAVGPSYREQDPEKRKAMREELANVTIPRYLSAVERRIAAWSTADGCCVGNSLSIADVRVFCSVRQLRSGNLDYIPTTIADSYSKIIAVHDKVAKHPKVAAWYAAKK